MLGHYYIACALGLAYLIFNGVYVGAGGTADGNPYIYTIMDWNNTKSESGLTLGIAYSLGILLILGPLMYLFHWGLTEIRNRFIPRKLLKSYLPETDKQEMNDMKKEEPKSKPAIGGKEVEAVSSSASASHPTAGESGPGAGSHTSS